jgi:Ni/Fe-hydrogenase 1 B-type cytochrome subunit
MTTTTTPRDVISEDTQEVVAVRIWELPVRLTHWVIFFAVIVLSVTGYYMGNPYAETGTEPGFLMARMRWAHLFSAWVFIAALIARLIWSLTGNRHARWDQFIPVSKARRKAIPEWLKYYLFARDEAPPVVGHNPLAGVAYTFVYLMFGVQILTGMALHGLHEPGGWIANLTGWTFGIVSIPTARLIHHIIMWMTWGFVVHHVYSALFIDTEEKSGIVSSILSGYRRVPRNWL